MFIYLIIFHLLFSQNEVIENTTEIIYKTNNQGLIGFDSINGYFKFPKNEPNNFMFGIGLISSGINSDNSTTFSSFSFENNQINFKIGNGENITNEKFEIYQSQYFDRNTGESFLSDIAFPLYQYDENKPGVYENNLEKRNIGKYIKPFIQSNNDLFSVFYDSSGGVFLEYHQRILNFSADSNIIVETKIINRNDFKLKDCFFSPYLDVDISNIGNEFIEIRDNSAKIIDDNLIFYTTNKDSDINYYMGFRYLQKSKVHNGYYAFDNKKQIESLKYNILNPTQLLNIKNTYRLMQESNKELLNSEIRAIASIGPINLSINDTLVFTYTIAFASPKFAKVTDNIESMENIISTLNGIEDFYYSVLFVDYLTVNNTQINNEELIIFDIDNLKYIEYSKLSQLEKGKYLILKKKSNKFELVKKIIRD